MVASILVKFSIFIGMFSNALAFTILSPFSSQLVQHFGMASDRTSTGTWVGLLSFVLMVGRGVCSPVWGAICDRYGRRPCNLAGLSSIILFTLTFGLSTNYWTVFISRGLIGALACVSLMCNIVIAELTNNDPGTIAWLVITWQLGTISGNILGGSLADPNGSGLTDWWVFDEYPYLLPNLVVCAFVLVSLALWILNVPETLKRGEAHSEQRSSFTLLKDRTIQQFLLMVFMWMLIEVGFYEVVTLWCWADKVNGGFEMSTIEIGNLMGISSFMLLAFEAPAFRLLRKYANIVKLTRLMCLLGALVLCLIPACSLFNDAEYLKYFLLGTSCIVWWLISFVVLASMNVMQNNCAPNKERGKMCGIVMTCNSASRSLSPIIFGPVFAFTSKDQMGVPFNFSFSFLLMGALCIFSFFVANSKNLENLHKPCDEGIASTTPLLEKPS